jgi:hypothetical protein
VGSDVQVKLISNRNGAAVFSAYILKEGINNELELIVKLKTALRD